MSTPLREADRYRNAVLAQLPDHEYERVASELRPLDAELRQPVYDKDKPIEFVYFPLTAVYSLVALADEQHEVEVCTIGNEGMVGLPVFLGAATSPNRAYCQVPGRALELTVSALHRLATYDGTLHRLLHQYTQATVVQLAQNVACHRTHAAEQRASLWLLFTHDRVGADEFVLTQQFLAQMLGLRRATVSEVASRLAADGLIEYSRGRVKVLDRGGLERASCECYRVVREEFDRLIGW